MSTCTVKGRVKVQVVDHLGNVVVDYPEQPNLILDQGLDRVAEVLWCDIFKYAVKGNLIESALPVPMKEVMTGTFALTGTALVATGSRDLVAGDVGKLVRTTNVVAPAKQVECIIEEVTGLTTANVKISGYSGVLANYTGRTVNLYAVNRTSMTESLYGSRTDTYSNAATENSTTQTGAVRDFKRTFLFPAEPKAPEPVDGTYTTGTSTISITTLKAFTLANPGFRIFTADDVGKYIEAETTGQYFKIATVAVGGLTGTVDRAPLANITGDHFRLYGYNSYSHIGFSDAYMGEPLADKFSWTGSGPYTITNTTTVPTYSFTAADIGKRITFADSGKTATIVSVLTGTTATVDLAEDPPSAATNRSVYLYPVDNLNIMVRLETGGVAKSVRALGVNPEIAGQQVKVTYLFQITFTPATAPQAIVGQFGGDIAIMGNPNAASMVLESIATSRINPTDGQTDRSAIGLEPSEGGYVGMSPASNPLVPVASAGVIPDRSSGVDYVDLVPGEYTPGQFTRTSLGIFGINDGIGTLWRTFGIYDPNNRVFLLTALWTAAVKKPSTHQLSFQFRKTWNRDLS